MRSSCQQVRREAGELRTVGYAEMKGIDCVLRSEMIRGWNQVTTSPALPHQRLTVAAIQAVMLALSPREHSCHRAIYRSPVALAPPQGRWGDAPGVMPLGFPFLGAQGQTELMVGFPFLLEVMKTSGSGSGQSCLPPMGTQSSSSVV